MDNFTMSENSGSFGMQQRQDRFGAIGDLIVGPPGPPGPQGPPGADGKSAYQSAVEGGYQGTETEFNDELSDIRYAALLARDAADDAEAAAEHYPKIQNGTWWVWDVEREFFVDTGISAQGPKGDTGPSASMTILSYGNSTWADFIAAYNSNSIVYCRASSAADPSSGSQTRLAFMAYVNNASSPTSVEFQYYRSVGTHTDAQQGDQVFIYKLTSAGTWTVTVREAYTKIAAGTNMTSSYSNGTLTLSPDLTGYRTASAQDAIDEAILGNLAMIESSQATAAHAVGEYIVYNGQLYKVTAAISPGETLTVGTNIAAVSGGGLNDLKRIANYNPTMIATGVTLLGRSLMTVYGEFFFFRAVVQVTTAQIQDAELFQLPNYNYDTTTTANVLVSRVDGGNGYTTVSIAANQTIRVVLSSGMAVGRYEIILFGKCT